VNLAAACTTTATSTATASAEQSAEASTLKQVAAAALVLGQQVSKTAAALGVDRRTIQRWIQFDPDFQAALAETKLEVVVTSRQSLLALAETAVDLVETKLADEQSPRVAIALLRGMGILGTQMLVPSSQAEAEGADPSGELENEKRAQSATLGTGNEKRAQSATFDGDANPAGLTRAELAALAAAEKCESSDLTPQQRRAVTDLFIGKPLAEVAAAASTGVETIRGWLCQDRSFFALLSELQFDRLNRLKYRLLTLTDCAVGIVRQAIVGGDARMAMILLRGLGLAK
jgi:hypothetical protein